MVIKGRARLQVDREALRASAKQCVGIIFAQRQPSLGDFRGAAGQHSLWLSSSAGAACTCRRACGRPGRDRGAANKPGGCASAWAPLSRAGARAGAQVATAELRANVLAAYVAGGRSADVPAVMAAMKFGPRDSFEIAFNAACALLGAGDAPAAEQQLLLAQRLGARAALTLTHPVRFRHCTVTLHISARVPSMRTPLVAFQRSNVPGNCGRTPLSSIRHPPTVANLILWDAWHLAEQTLGRLRERPLVRGAAAEADNADAD